MHYWGFGFGSLGRTVTFATETLTTKTIRLMLNFFVEGGLGFMSILTALLVAIFFAAWKAPRWVKEIGLFALLFGILGTILGLSQMASSLANITPVEGGHIPMGVVATGFRLTLNTAIYGISIYLVSLIVRVIQKPRL